MKTKENVTILYTLPANTKCVEIARRLDGWNTQFITKDINSYRKLHSDRQLKAPILIVNNVEYEYEQMNTRDKLWKAIHETPKIPTLKILKPHNYTQHKSKSGQIDVDATNDARINVTVLRAMNGIDITDIIKTWTMGERAAALILWRIGQHQRADELLMLADMVASKAESYDPYRNDNKHNWIGDIDKCD
jgi:hypothetical protein